MMTLGRVLVTQCMGNDDILYRYKVTTDNSTED